MKFFDILSKIFGYAGIPIAVMVFMISIEENDPELVPAILGFLGAGIWGLTRMKKQRRLKEELELLEMAVRNDGQITLVEAALEMRIPITRIKKRLKTLEDQGVMGIEITETGEMIYTITNALDLERKRLMEDYFIDPES